MTIDALDTKIVKAENKIPDFGGLVKKKDCDDEI